MENVLLSKDILIEEGLIDLFFYEPFGGVFNQTNSCEFYLRNVDKIDETIYKTLTQIENSLEIKL